GVSIHHLTLTEAEIEDYRTFFKVKPPLRTEEDRLAIVDAVRTGLITTVSSMHTPQDEESKRLPFEEAASGAVGLETFLSAMLGLVAEGLLSLPDVFRAGALAPAKRLGLPGGRLSVGAPADLVLFVPDAKAVLDRAQLHSKSKNTPFDGREMTGRVLGTWVRGQRVYGD
ncbi:MAG: amidohydrolase family protein, partial [Pseudomonadota bacterium]